jgi:pSer/pThr/pTyr-binding forkhead associated (FHA) protein
MGSTYRLILQSGPSAGTEYPLEKTEMILGRDISNDLVINDPEVSRRHLKLTLDGSTYRIEDLGSTNGTFIRGQRLAAPVLLRPGEIITLGEKVVLRFETFTSDPNATVAVQRGANQGTSPAARVPVAPSVLVAQAPIYQPAPSAPTPVAPPPAQYYQPVPQAPVSMTPPINQQPAPYYQSISATPVYPAANIPLQPATPKKSNKGLIILLVIVGIIVLFIVIPAIIIDSTNSYCTVIPGITNLITKLFFGGVVACP